MKPISVKEPSEQMIPRKQNSRKKNKILVLVYMVIIFIGIAKTYFDETVAAFSMPTSGKVILIDAGHGGWDPGMVSSDNTYEKDINLEITKNLQTYLEQSGAYVLLTRADDSALSDRKRADLKTRTEIADNSKCDLIISIHQNSFPKESVKGAQVFYYNDSENSKNLAELIQSELTGFADTSNKRAAKPNTNYYMLKRTKVPSVIVECGFLSNNQEREKLKNENYQERIAWAIYMGIVKYLDSDSQA